MSYTKMTGKSKREREIVSVCERERGLAIYKERGNSKREKDIFIFCNILT